MKSIKIILPILLALILVNSAFAQNKFYGTVIEIIDGKTLVVEPQPKVKIKLELQFIETPEAEQPLHNVIKDHLQNLVLNKYVEFVPKNLNSQTKPVGKVLLNGVDVSQQMLRDGAAWYSIPEKNIHDENESKIYQDTESLAKNEKRGVWSIADLKPAWEFRAEKAEKIRQEELKKQEEEKARQEKVRAEARAKAAAEAEAKRKARAKANQYGGLDSSGSGLGIEVWQDTSVAGMGEKPGYPSLLYKYIPEYDLEYTLTGANFETYKSGKSQLKIDSRSFHIKQDNAPPQFRDFFVIGFLTESEKGSFFEVNNLTITADNKPINLGKAHHLTHDKGGAIQELLLYIVSEKQLESISNAKTVSVKLGVFTGSVDQKYQKVMNDLLKSAKEMRIKGRNLADRHNFDKMKLLWKSNLSNYIV